MEEIETIFVNEEILKDFISCHRKAFLMEKSLQKGSSFTQTQEGHFVVKYQNMWLSVKVKGIEVIDGEKTVILDIHSKTIRERHKILASFLAFIMDLKKIKMAVALSTSDGLKKIYPRREKAENLLQEIKKILSDEQPPDPTFSFACRNCPFHDECVEFASNKGDISMINGIGQGRKKALQKAGYSNVEKISNADPDRLSKYMGISKTQAEKIVLQAKSIGTSKWFLLCKGERIPRHKVEYFFDVEKGADETYLLGVLLKVGKKTIYRYFVLLDDDWEDNWEEFLKFVKLHPRAPIYHYDVFDRRVVEKFGVLSRKSVKNVLNRLEDLYAIVTSSFVLPVRFYSLKDVARAVGFEWRVENFNGYEAMKALDEWKLKRDDSLLQKIVTYNEDDCRALLSVKEKMAKVLSG